MLSINKDRGKGTEYLGSMHSDVMGNRIFGLHATEYLDSKRISNSDVMLMCRMNNRLINYDEAIILYHSACHMTLDQSEASL